MCDAAVGEQLTISPPNSASSGCAIATCGVAASRERRSGSATCHCGGDLVDDHDSGLRRVLRLVPGVEQLLLVMALGIVEQPPAGPRDEDRGRAGCGPTGAGRSAGSP